MAEIVRAAAYVPAWVAAGHRVPGPDEDSFTMSATAIERALGPRDIGPGAWTLFLLGEFDASADGLYPAWLGGAPPIVRRPADASSLAEALAQARRAEGASLVVAAELPTAEAPVDRAPGSGAVAFLVERSPPSFVRPDPTLAPRTGGALAAAWHWFSERPRSEAPLWVGDWEIERIPARAAPPSPDRIPSPPSRGVSEGAYVPRPRYLEGMPSRWELRAERCGHCGHLGFPARARCGGCGRTDALEAVRLPEDGGTILASTWIGKGGQPTEFDPQVEATGPYGVAIVELAPGARATFQLADGDPGEFRLGSRVATRLRRIYSIEGEWRYARKAVPLAPAPGSGAHDGGVEPRSAEPG